MNKQAIFDQTKEQLLTMIQEDLHFDSASIEDIYKNMYQFETFFRALLELPIKEREEKEQTENKSLLPDQKPVNTPPLCTFVRNLKGGCVAMGDQTIYVPESIIRRLNMEHGDQLIVTDKGQGHYYFEIAEKTNDPSVPNRAVISYALIEEQDGILMASRSMSEGGENIKINDILHTFRIAQGDRQAFQLEPGDLVDIAYVPDNPSTQRVIWKHEIDDTAPITAPQKSGEYKEKAKRIVDLPQDLHNQTVLIIGLEPRKAIFKERIEERGGTFLFLEGMEQEERFIAAVQQADVVVILTSFIRHRASILAVKTCKETNTPFSIIDTLGISRIIQGALRPTSEDTGNPFHVY